MKLIARKAFTHPITRILSLCVVAGIAATLASFSQTSEPTGAVAPTAQTMPVARTLTSSDGRAIDVTILSKSDTAIKAKKADGKEFEIALDKLSDADKAFVAGLTAQEARKTSVLILVDSGSIETYRHHRAATLLRNNGFDVTIGVCPRRNAEERPTKEADDTFDEISKKEKAILVSTLKAIDHFDVLWIVEFGFDKTERAAASTKRDGGLGIDLRPNHFELTQHHQEAKKLSVIRYAKYPRPEIFLNELAKDPDKGKPSYYVKTLGKSWVFYDSPHSTVPHSKIEGSRESEELKKLASSAKTVGGNWRLDRREAAEAS